MQELRAKPIHSARVEQLAQSPILLSWHSGWVWQLSRQLGSALNVSYHHVKFPALSMYQLFFQTAIIGDHDVTSDNNRLHLV